jgi:hypothetical protein
MKKSLLLSLFISFCSLAFANNMLVQNVTTTDNNAVNKTIQVQFDISWDNSWRDDINWDAAWIFMKFKDANGLWQHAQLNQTGFTNGSGTANTLQVTSDKVGSWLYRSALGSGTFNSTGMQLQWNYGLSGLTNVTGLEVRVFAVEMVYVPEGDFNCIGAALPEYPIPQNNNYGFWYFENNNGLRNGLFNAPGYNFPLINTRLTPTLTYSDESSNNIRIKGDLGIDTDNNGIVDNTTYPIGYRAFYCYKYELTEQQYADFFNTLTTVQKTTLGLAGQSISLVNGQYYSSTPNIACGNSTPIRFLAFGDWAGIRPVSFLEFNKACYGPMKPIWTNGVNGFAAWGTDNIDSSTGLNTMQNSPFSSSVGFAATSASTRASSGASIYGIMDLTGSVKEPIVRLNYFSFNSSNGDGLLNINGTNNVSNWNSVGMILHIDQSVSFWSGNEFYFGFRYCRSAE